MADEVPSTHSDLELAEKLQIANDKVAKLTEMRKEDENLWSGIESRLLRSTTGLLNGIILTAEKNKELFESKFSTSSEAIDSLKQQVQELSSRFDAFEENLKSHALIMNSEAALPDAKEDLVGVKEKLEQEKMNIPLTADNLEKLESEAKCINGANAETEAVISKLRDSEKETISDDVYGELSGSEASLSQKEQAELNPEKEQREIYLNEQCETASLLKEEVSQLGEELNQDSSDFFDPSASSWRNQLRGDSFSKEIFDDEYGELSGSEASLSQIEPHLEKEQREISDQVSTDEEHHALHIDWLRQNRRERRERDRVKKSGRNDLRMKKRKQRGALNLRDSEQKTDALTLRDSEQKTQELSSLLSSLEIESKENSEKLQANLQRTAEESSEIESKEKKAEEAETEKFDPQTVQARLAYLEQTRGKKKKGPRFTPRGIERSTADDGPSTSENKAGKKASNIYVYRSKNMYFDP